MNNSIFDSVNKNANEQVEKMVIKTDDNKKQNKHAENEWTCGTCCGRSD